MLLAMEVEVSPQMWFLGENNVYGRLTLSVKPKGSQQNGF